jgi:hypothetical protein
VVGWTWPPLAIRGTVGEMTEHTRLVVCEGDETGQELLDEALRVLDPSVIGIPLELIRFDLSLEPPRPWSRWDWA